jgi:rhodanese-related sulfurtransferase
MNSKFQLLGIIFFLVSILGSCQSPSESEIRQKGVSEESRQELKVLTVDEFKERIGQNGVQLLDVRTPAEFSGGYIAGARNVDISQWKTFETEISKLDKSKPVMVYCAVGGRSGQASSYLEKQGFSQIYDLQGGMKAWIAESEDIIIK